MTWRFSMSIQHQKMPWKFWKTQCRCVQPQFWHGELQKHHACVSMKVAQTKMIDQVSTKPIQIMAKMPWLEKSKMEHEFAMEKNHH